MASPRSALPRASSERLAELLPRYLAAGDRADVDRALAAADDAKRYLHWQDFRLRPVPVGWTAEELWMFVKFFRASRAVPVLRQKSGVPFTVNRTDPMLAALHRIDKQEVLRRSLVASGLPVEATYRLTAEIEEAHHSSAIEGAVTTRRQSSELIRTGRSPKNRSEQMVLNNFDAMRHLHTWIEQPLTPALVREVQALVTRDTLDDDADVGRVREENDEVVIVSEQTGEVVYVPPPADELGTRLDELCRFANEDLGDDHFLHPVTRAILLHHQLAYDHPFVDGNGRTARTLFLWSVLRSGYSWFRALSISRAIHARRTQYYRSFVHVQTDDGDVTYFLRHQLRCLESEIEHLATFLAERAQTKEWLVRREARVEGLNSRQMELLDHALSHADEAYEAARHAAFHRVTQPTAWRDLTQLVERGLLEESKRGRKKIYRPSRRLRELGDRRPSEAADTGGS